jgi:tetratricopeptide (TPR) repeat protein
VVVSNSDCFARIPELHQISAQHNGIGEILFNNAWSKTFQEEYRLMKRTLLMMAALTFSLALFVPLASAETNVPGPAAQDPTPEEAAAYKAWFDANAAKDFPKAMELAKAYLEKFPSGKYLGYLKDKWIPSLYPFFFNKAVADKNVPEIIRIGKEVLARDADNLDYLSALVVQIRTFELFATPPNYAHAAEAAEFAERAIRLIEAGKTPTGADPKVFNKNVTLAYMHQTLAVIYDHDKNVDKALAEYDKAAALEPSNTAFFFHCGRIHNDKYAAAAQRYDASQKKVDAIPEADRNAAEPKPEVKAALDESKAAFTEVKNQAEAVVNCWVRYVALTADKPSETRTTVLGVVTGLYKFRNNNLEVGLQKLIEDNRTSATPVKMTPPPETPAQPKPAAEPNASAKPNGKKP